jgi:hypothetical protein
VGGLVVFGRAVIKAEWADETDSHACFEIISILVWAHFAAHMCG